MTYSLKQAAQATGKTRPTILQDMTRPDRENHKFVGGYVTVEKWKKLRHLVTETQRTANQLIDEAIDMLADKYGEQPQPPTGKKLSKRDRSPS